MEFPKVLIIGETFRLNGGGGITLANLFFDWPKEKVAVASSPRFIKQSNDSICNNYYQLGYEEGKFRWPFCITQRKEISGRVKVQNITVSLKHYDVETEKKGIVDILKKYLNNSFFINYYEQYIPSNKFIDWITEFKPDIIYSQLSSYSLIRFIEIIQNTFNIPTCIHFMDDWPKTIATDNLLNKVIFRRTIINKLNVLIENSACLLSISDAMSKEYSERYKKIIKAFHNPVDISLWDIEKKISNAEDNKFRILYTGRISIANKNTLIKSAEIINGLNRNEFDVQLHLYSKDRIPELLKLDCVKYFSPVIHSEIPKIMIKYDLLLLPLDFDSKSINFARLSMPTKTAEYMICGVPTLVLAPKNTALYQYAEKDKWAYVCDNLASLEKAIKKLYSNSKLRNELVLKAKEVCYRNHNAINIRKIFLDTLSNAIHKK